MSPAKREPREISLAEIAYDFDVAGSTEAGSRAMKRVPLTRGLFATVDDADYESVMAAGPWRADVNNRTVYAIRNVRRSDGRKFARLNFPVATPDPDATRIGLPS